MYTNCEIWLTSLAAEHAAQPAAPPGVAPVRGGEAGRHLERPGRALVTTHFYIKLSINICFECNVRNIFNTSIIP